MQESCRFRWWCVQGKHPTRCHPAIQTAEHQAHCCRISSELCACGKMRGFGGVACGAHALSASRLLNAAAQRSCQQRWSVRESGCSWIGACWARAADERLPAAGARVCEVVGLVFGAGLLEAASLYFLLCGGRSSSGVSMLAYLQSGRACWLCITDKIGALKPVGVRLHEMQRCMHLWVVQCMPGKTCGSL